MKPPGGGGGDPEESPPSGNGGSVMSRVAPQSLPALQYGPECAKMESWLDEHQEFVHDYFCR